MIKLIVTDMDRTFLNSQGTFDQDLFQQAQAMMHQQGISFAPCTGKQCERVEELFGTQAHDMWILGDSATRIKHQQSFVYESLLSNVVGLTMIEALERIDATHTIIACTKHAAYVKASISKEEYQIVRGSYAKVEAVESFSTITAPFIKITVHDRYGNGVKTREQLYPFQHEAYMVVSEHTWIDITNADVNKGTTARQLQHLLNVTPEQTMVFGDGYNDLELLDAGAYSFAVRNAYPEVREAANYIIRSNDDQAVLRTIIQLLHLQARDS